MRIPISYLVLGLLTASLAEASALEDKVWIHGSEDCETNRDPAFEVFQFDAATYVLRQNKCVNFEAPFVYVLFGEHTVFVQDTGATEEAEKAPIYDVVRKLVDQRQAAGGEPLRVVVTHSHSHGDHTTGDVQFRGKPHVTLVEPSSEAVRAHFNFTQWPKGVAKVDLGGRELLVMPAPGHQDEAVAVYDPHTRWLLTGDTVYPGQLYVRDWDIYKASIARLVEFGKTKPISAVMGTHIEMSKASQIYERGSTYQPGEMPLPLAVDDLVQLDAALRKAGATPQEIKMHKFMVVPITRFQRMIGDFLKWVTGG